MITESCDVVSVRDVLEYGKDPDWAVDETRDRRDIAVEALVEAVTKTTPIHVMYKTLAHRLVLIAMSGHVCKFAITINVASDIAEARDAMVRTSLVSLAETLVECTAGRKMKLHCGECGDARRTAA